MKHTVLAAVMAAASGLGCSRKAQLSRRFHSTTWAWSTSTSSSPTRRPRRDSTLGSSESALHQRPVRDTLRYFVLLGDLPADRQVGYIAIGAAGQRQPAIGHYCVLATVYDRAGMASALQGAGFGVAGAGPTGMWPDPDRLELQLFQPPAGLVTAAVPSPLQTERDGLLAPRGVDHMLLRVSSLEKSLPYYRMVYGTAAERPRDANGRVWFQLARNTRLGLEEAAPGQAPTIAHYAITVAPFDRSAFEARLRELKARVIPSADEPDVVRFADDNGIIVEVKAAR